MTHTRNPHFDAVQRVQSARLQARKLSADAIAAQFAAMPAQDAMRAAMDLYRAAASRAHDEDV